MAAIFIKSDLIFFSSIVIIVAQNQGFSIRNNQFVCRVKFSTPKLATGRVLRVKTVSIQPVVLIFCDSDDADCCGDCGKHGGDNRGVLVEVEGEGRGFCGNG